MVYIGTWARPALPAARRDNAVGKGQEAEEQRASMWDCRTPMATTAGSPLNSRMA